MAFTVLYDACVLHPAPLRDLLVRLGLTGLVRVRWTERILDECFRSILERRPDLSPTSLARTRELMCRGPRRVELYLRAGIAVWVSGPDTERWHHLCLEHKNMTKLKICTGCVRVCQCLRCRVGETMLHVRDASGRPLSITAYRYPLSDSGSFMWMVPRD